MGLKGSWPPGSAYSPLFIPPSPHGSLGKAVIRECIQAGTNTKARVPECMGDSVGPNLQQRPDPSPDTPIPAHAALSRVVRVSVRRALAPPLQSRSALETVQLPDHHSGPGPQM